MRRARAGGGRSRPCRAAWWRPGRGGSSRRRSRRRAVEVEPDGDLRCRCLSWEQPTPRLALAMVHSDGNTWAISGIDLHRDPAGGGCGPASSARCARRSRPGGCSPGTRLPSSRALALDLGIARNTVADAYGQLVAEGWLAARQGSGTSVADTPRRPRRRPHAATAGRARHATTCGRAARTCPVPPSRLARRRPPSARSRRRTTRSATATRVAATSCAGARRISRPRPRRARPGPDRRLLGFVQALGLLVRVQVERGVHTLAVEAYGHLLHRDGRRAPACARRRSRVDLRAPSWTTAERRGRPAHPGAPVPARRPARAGAAQARRRWAIDTDGLIVEDDYDGEFRYDRQAVGAMQALAPRARRLRRHREQSPRARVRLGWLVAPGASRRAGGRGEAPGRRAGRYPRSPLTGRLVGCRAYDAAHPAGRGGAVYWLA